MTVQNFISFSIALALLSCGQGTTKQHQPYHESRELLANPEGDRKDTLNLPNSDTTALDYVIFGVYCGECSNHCATMYRYNAGGNAHTLLVDSTDSYFKNKGEIIFGNSVIDTRRFYLAQTVFNHIPKELLTTTKQTERFGCPDCTDGCGIYVEFKQEDKVKKFAIDYQTEQLSGDIKTFAVYLKSLIEQLNAKTKNSFLTFLSSLLPERPLPLHPG